MRQKKILSLLLFIIGFPIIVQAGDIKMLNVVPPSPQSQTLMKFVDYPVNYSAGLPTVDIPLYTIESKSLTLPISLSYHASGFKPNEKDNLLGQGWTLNAGGRITRQIKQTPDEFCIQNKIKNETEFPFHCYGDTPVGCIYDRSDPEVKYLANAAKAYGTNLDFDTEYDIFYYECPNSVSGKFCFERNDQNKLLPVTLPYRPIVITPGDSLVEAGPYDAFFKNKLEIRFFDIIDQKGVQYRYGRSLIDGANVIEESKSYNMNRILTSYGKTSWLLTEIISADKTDTISFEYRFTEMAGDVYIPYYKSYTTTNYLHTPHPDPQVDYTGMNATMLNTYTQARLTCIKFKQGKVIINYSFDPNLLIQDTKRISDMAIYDKDGNIIKGIRFNQSLYDVHSPYWNKLDKISFGDIKGNYHDMFSFEYYPSPDSSFPVMSELTSITYTHNIRTYTSHAIDYWGFYNGANGNINPLASAKDEDCYGSHPFYRELYGEADRESHPDFTKTGILKTITYPTGGSTTYEYEGNMSGYGIPVGGVRIHKITHNDKGSRATNRIFSYGEAISIMGSLESKIKFLDNFKSFNAVVNGGQEIPPNDWNISLTAINSASSQVDYNLNAQPIVYCEVTEQFRDGDNYIGKIFRSYDSKSLMTDRDMISDPFPSLDMQNQTPWPPFLMTYDACNGNKIFGGKVYYQRNFRFGDLLEKDQIIYDATNHIKKVINKGYSCVKKNILTGLYAQRRMSVYNGDIWTNNQFWKRNYYIEQLVQQLDSVTTTDYFGPNSMSLVTKTKYTYNDKSLIASETETKSDGTEIKNTYSYPFNESCAECSTMVNRNIITPVVVSRMYKKSRVGESLLKTIQTDYNQFGNPLTVRTSILDNPLEDRIYYGYDNVTQNLQTAQKVGEANTTYIWGYRNTYPVAKIDGASFDEVRSAFGGTLPDLKSGGLTASQISTMKTNLPSAHIKTYGYKPLIGMISETDSRDVSTYFTYDTFNRLYLVKDRDNNFLNQYRYAYSGEKENGTGGYSLYTHLNFNNSFFYVGSTMIAEVEVTGGSQDISYEWSLKNGSSILSTGTSKNFNYTCSETGILSLQCVIKDTYTGQTKTVSKNMYCYAYPSYTVTPGSANYNYAQLGTATISDFRGGSGNFTYNWYLKNSSGVILANATNATNSFTYNCWQAGTLTIQCDVIDNTTSQVTTRTTTVTCSPVVISSCNFSLLTGYSGISNNITSSGTVVSFSLVFRATAFPLNLNVPYHVADVCEGSQPSVTRVVNCTTSNRTWQITFNPDKTVYCKIISGNPLNINTGDGFGSSYNLW